MDSYQSLGVCVHGSLRRSCDLCYYMAEVARLTAESEALRTKLAEAERDAERYRYIRAEFVQMHSPHMNGDHGWRFRHFRWSGNSFDAALDKGMREQPLKGADDADRA